VRVNRSGRLAVAAAGRLGQAALVAVGAVLVTFAVTRMVPGDPAVAWAGPRATAEQLAAVRADHGLDRPFPVQVVAYFTDLLRGDWGVSLHTRQPVLDDLARTAPATLELVGAGLSLAALVGVPAGFLAGASRRHRVGGTGGGRPGGRGGAAVDGLVRLSTAVGASLPVFWLALLLRALLVERLAWLPVAGRYDPGLDRTAPLTTITGLTTVDAALTGNGAVLGSALAHLLLPAAVVAVYPAAVLSQITRAAVITESNQPYVRTVRALGFGHRRALVRFASRPAAGPVLAATVLLFGSALVSTVLVESIFDWPGLGSYAAAAVRSADIPSIAGVTVLIALAYVAANTVVEVLQAVLDPRISRS
jgi:peptide/nickel transport system permease protein